MLSKILQKETCAGCRFCCSFRRCSLWETPLFPMEVTDKYVSKGYSFNTFDINGASCGQLELAGNYKTESEDEEVPCSFLDPNKGCTLDDSEKPFDCKIWPLRIMNKSGSLVIALTPTCPAINEIDIEEVRRLTIEELKTPIVEYAKRNPFIIKEYKEGFPVLVEL